MSVLDPASFVAYTQTGIGPRNKGDLFLSMRLQAGTNKFTKLFIPNAPNIVWGFDGSANPVGIPLASFFSGNYGDLANAPTKLSQFTNDSGFQTAANVDARFNTLVGTAPANLDTLGEITQQLANDESAVAALTTTVASKLSTATFNTFTATLKSIATSGSYADLTSKPTIPTATSQLSNDANFITLAQIPAASPTTTGLMPASAVTQLAALRQRTVSFFYSAASLAIGTAVLYRYYAPRPQNLIGFRFANDPVTGGVSLTYSVSLAINGTAVPNTTVAGNLSAADTLKTLATPIALAAGDHVDIMRATTVATGITNYTAGGYISVADT